MSNRHRGPSKDASYQISIHLAKRFQRRFFYESTNQKQELPMAAMFANGSERNWPSLWKTFHRCFLQRIYIVGRIWISYCLALSCVARFYATTEQTLIHLFWNALRIRRKINQLHQSSCYTLSIYYIILSQKWRSASIVGMMREERTLKFKFESWPPIIGGIMKVKRANRLMSIIDEI